MKTRLQAFWLRMKLYARVAGAGFAAAVVTIFALGFIFISLAVFQPKRLQSVEPLGQMPVPQPSDRVMVVAAHPDDEFLSSAGYMMRAKQNGAQVRVVLVTSGEGTGASDVLLHRTPFANPSRYIQQGDARQKESLQALHTLGLGNEDIFFLGFPNRGLKSILLQHWSQEKPYRSSYTQQNIAPFDTVFDAAGNYSGEKLVSDIQRLIEINQPTILITHSQYDEHDDHRAVYYAVTQALQQAEKNMQIVRPREFFFLVHYAQYSFPARAKYDYWLFPPLHVGSDTVQWSSFDLTPQEFLFKKQGIVLYKSQFANPYLKLLLSSFVKHNELFYQRNAL